MACDDASPADDFPDTVMPRGAPCMCGKKCRGRSGSAVFLGLFLLSLTLHAVTLVCYLDLRSEVKREITHQKRDSVVTRAGVDLDDPVGVLPPGHPRMDTGSRHSEEDREVKKKTCDEIQRASSVGGWLIAPVSVSGCQVVCLCSVLGMFYWPTSCAESRHQLV